MCPSLILHAIVECLPRRKDSASRRHGGSHPVQGMMKEQRSSSLRSNWAGVMAGGIANICYFCLCRTFTSSSVFHPLFQYPQFCCCYGFGAFHFRSPAHTNRFRPPPATPSGLPDEHLSLITFFFHRLAGNDPELDPNRPPAPPARAVDRPAARHGKREAPKEAPATQPRENNNRRGGRVTAGNDAGM